MVNKLNFVLIGASSDLAKEFIKINKKHNLNLISSNKLSDSHNHLYVDDYIDDINKILSFCENIDNPIIIFFNGYLKENRPLQLPSEIEIQKTFIINYLIPYTLTKSFISNNLKVKKFVYISSFAAVKPRFKNFIYGYCKKLLEESVLSQNLDNVLILRFGKINTTMSEAHSKTVFDLKKDTAANIISKKIMTSTGLKYANFYTKLLAIIVLVLPKAVFKYLKI